jgi:hypothetical protein
MQQNPKSQVLNIKIPFGCSTEAEKWHDFQKLKAGSL